MFGGEDENEVVKVLYIQYSIEDESFELARQTFTLPPLLLFYDLLFLLLNLVLIPT